MKKLIVLFGFVLVQSLSLLYSQTASNPIQIVLTSPTSTVSPGGESYITMQLKVPKGIWMGAKKEEARTPPGTMIKTPEIEGFSFKEPLYPASIKEWVPAKLGTTQVYKEFVTIVIPYEVDKRVREGEYDLNFSITYTPGYNAGRMATHNNEKYSIPITVVNNSPSPEIATPSLGTVGDDFYVKAKSYEGMPNLLKFMFTPLSENRGTVMALHKIWLDNANHGKTVRFMPFPIFSTSKIVGTSFGMGASFANATREGTMTGMFSMSGYYNNLIGGAVSLQAISCPGAYHNYQLSAVFGGEGYRNVTLHYENFTIANSRFGLDLNLASTNEPRMRYYGLGAKTTDANQTAYEQTNLGGILELYSLPMQNLRIGAGIGYIDRSVGTSFQSLKVSEGIPFLQETNLVDGLLGLSGATQLSLRANIIYDHRDQEFASSRGFYTKMTASRNSLSNITEDIASSYYGLDIDMRQYFSGPSQKLVVLMRGALSLKSESNLPFYMLSSIGGLVSSRAYDRERFFGQHSGFVSAEMRYTLFTMPVLGYPMSIEMGAFVDVGQVFGDGEAFGDELNVDPGISIRMINKPNVGIILNYAIGADGGYLTGGVGLPF